MENEKEKIELYREDDFSEDVFSLSKKIGKGVDEIFGISRGGIIPGYALAKILGCRYQTINPFVDLPELPDGQRFLLVDDIEDSGATFEFFRKKNPKIETCALVSKKGTCSYWARKSEKWVRFFWESPKNDEAGGMKQAVVTLLRGVGENPLREGLLETPARVEKAFGELTEGYKIDIPSLFKVFEKESSDQIVLLKDIPYYSLCEHHMLPFWGKASVAYIPNKKIIGLSKLARIVTAYSRRLQVQERLTQQVADSIQKYLNPKGVAVIIEGEHLCMRMRGIEREGKMKTSCLKGAFRKDAKARQELFSLLKD